MDYSRIDDMTPDLLKEINGDIGAYLYWSSIYSGYAHPGRVQHFIDTGSDVNKYFIVERGPKHAEGTPLSLICHSCHSCRRWHNYPIIKVLLDNGADIGISVYDKRYWIWLKGWRDGKWSEPLVIWHRNRRWSDFFDLL